MNTIETLIEWVKVDDGKTTTEWQNGYEAARNYVGLFVDALRQQQAGSGEAMTYPRAKYFQAGFVGSGPDAPMIVHYAGEDVTRVASFSRIEDRDYFLSLIASPPPARELTDSRECTCHPDDNPPRPCPRKFALSECIAADRAQKEEK